MITTVIEDEYRLSIIRYSILPDTILTQTHNYQYQPNPSSGMVIVKYRDGTGMRTNKMGIKRGWKKSHTDGVGISSILCHSLGQICNLVVATCKSNLFAVFFIQHQVEMMACDKFRYGIST